MSRFRKLKAHARTLRRPERIGALALFGAGVLEEIEGILGVTSPHEEVREALAESLCAYAGRSPYVGGSVGGYSGEGSSAQIRRRVEAISGAARSMRAALAPADAAAETVTVWLETAGIDVGGLKEQAGAVLAALKKIKTDKGGHRPLADPEHWLLLDRAADIFERTAQKRATLSDHRGKRTFSGGFFRMAELVEAAAATATKRQPATNSALGTRLRRLLELRAEPSPIF